MFMAGLTHDGPFLGRNMLVPDQRCFSYSSSRAPWLALPACLHWAEPDLPRSPTRSTLIAGILAAIPLCWHIIDTDGFLSVPAAPLKPVEWIITIPWIVIGMAIFMIFGRQSEGSSGSYQALKVFHHGTLN